MKTKLIIRLPIEDHKEMQEFAKKFHNREEVIIPESAKILIKDRDGYWREAHKERFKLGELEWEK